MSSAPSADWTGVASDSTGKYLIAAAGGLSAGAIYVNSNYGSGLWSKTSAPIAWWSCIVSDSTGQYLAAGVGYNSGGIYTNANYGYGSWTLTSAPINTWSFIASDKSGQRLIAVVSGGGIFTGFYFILFYFFELKSKVIREDNFFVIWKINT
jgi:hypothetical protein